MSETFARGYEVLKKELISWFDIAVSTIPSLVLATLVALVFWILSRVIHRIIENLLAKTPINQTLRSLFSRAATVGVFLLALFLILGILGLQKTVTSLLAGAGVLGLVLGLAFQDFMSNFFASILISVRQPFGEGDIISTNDHMGTVINVNLRNTVIKNFDGQQILVPNRLVVEKVLQNYTRYGSRRVSIPVGVAYETDLEHAAKTAIAAVSAMEGVLDKPAVVVHFDKLADSSINFNVRFWIRYPGADFFEAQSNAIVAIKNAFDKANIEIPFPITTLDLSRAQKTIPGLADWPRERSPS